MTREELVLVEQEVRNSINGNAKAFCTKRGITSGWDKDTHVEFYVEQQHDVIDSFVDTETAPTEEQLKELKFRLHVLCDELGHNASAFRQRLENPKVGVLSVGTKKMSGSKLASAYVD